MIDSRSGASTLFQSAPLTGARGDAKGVKGSKGGGGFQSAPLTGARGDLSTFEFWLESKCFNPLPSPEQGEMSKVANPQGPQDCFNPLPSPEQGEMDDRVAFGLGIECFNPLPSPEQGEMNRR